MNKRKLLFNALGSVMLLASCGGNVTSENREMDRFVSELMGRMTIEEKIGQLCQCSGGFATGQYENRQNRGYKQGTVGFHAQCIRSCQYKKVSGGCNEIATADSFDFRT